MFAGQESSEVSAELSALQVALARAESAAVSLQIELDSCKAALGHEASQRQVESQQLLALQNAHDALAASKSLLDDKVRQTQCGVNCFILDSRRVLAPAPKVLGPNPDFAPF